MKQILLILAWLVCACAFYSSALGQSKPLVTEWVNEDIHGLSAITQLIPSEKQNIEGVKARLRKDWHVEEYNLGFGAKYLELEKGWGYSKGYVHALTYNDRVAQYEAGIESYSEHWPQIKGRIVNEWKENRGPEVSEEEHGLVFRQTLATVLSNYQANIALTLGSQTPASVPPALKKSYGSLTDPMENSTLSGTHGNEDIETLVKAKRIDLLENVLRAYNPGARVLAALALLELEKSGARLSSQTQAAIDRVLNLSIDLHACVYDMCSYVTAQEALHWFDSGRAWPKIRLPQKKP